jgi:MYXO-CTERM domain-containing protein
MIARPTRWIASAIFLTLAAGAALAIISRVGLGSLSITTGQVGVPFSSTLQATGGLAPYSYSINSGALPTGLNFSPTTPTSGPMTISGTPTVAGTYNFTVIAFDSTPAPTFAPGPAAARRSGLAQSGNHAAGTSSAFAITIAPGAASTAGAPTSPWTLAMVMAGLAGAGFWRLRQMRRA